MTKLNRISVTDFLNQDASSPAFQELIKSIGEGALFIYPTETIYGIGGIPEKGVEERIYKAKVRKPDNPLLLISSSLDHFSFLNLKINKIAEKLAEKFWPGNLTMILPHQGDESIKTGIRVSNHPFIRKLCENLKKPIFSTSANISGEDYKNNADFIFQTFKENVDLMFDMGELPQSEPSTVVMVEKDGVKVLREGVIRKAEIEFLFKQ